MNSALRMVVCFEVGKRADLIVLEKNLFDVPSDKLAADKVQMTMMNGRITHRDGL